MANSRKMTAADRRRYQRLRARAMAKRAVAQKKAQELDEEMLEDIPEEELDEEIEAKRCARAARRAYANYLRRKKAQEVVEKDEEEDEEEAPKSDVPADIEPAPEEENAPEEKKDDKEVEARRAARRRAALRRARRRAAMRRKAQEVSDDLKDVDGDSSNIEELHKNADEPSDDLTITDEEKGEVQIIPPASVDEAESKVLSAYALIDAQIAQKVISANVRKASLASSYCKKYTSGEMKFAAEQLNKVGSAGKKAGNVRVTRRSSMPKTAAVAKKTGFDDQCLFA